MSGSFEYALDYLIDNEIDLSGFDARYNNDDTGAPVYDPAVNIAILALHRENAAHWAHESKIKSTL